MNEKHYFINDKSFITLLILSVVFTSWINIYVLMEIAPSQREFICECYEVPGTSKYMKVMDSRRLTIVLVSDDFQAINKEYRHIGKSGVNKFTFLDFAHISNSVEISENTLITLSHWDGFRHALVMNDSLRLEPIAESIIPIR